MRYRLNKLIYGPVGGVQVNQLDRGPTWFDDDLKVAFLKGELTFIRTTETVLVEGTIETATDVQCVRSLEFFSLQLKVPLVDIAFYLPDFTPEPDAEDLETLREEIIMAIPFNPINPIYAGDEPPALPNGIEDTEGDDWLTVRWHGSQPDDPKTQP
jgi:uncharacterized metal-binding protein YceD (DUF177 family)